MDTMRKITGKDCTQDTSPIYPQNSDIIINEYISLSIKKWGFQNLIV